MLPRRQLFTLLLTLFWIHGLQAQKISLGIDRLQASNFQAIEGKRVGLLTHPAGVNKHGVSTIEILHRSPQVNLVALFGPEHGIYGNEKANQPIDDQIDPKTGLPVYSLYGKYRKPKPSMLAGLDALIIDLQDIGVRSYTYVSCMRYAMEACFENDVEVIILDRPNPLGGLKVDGPPLDPEWRSYVGAFNVPYVHGLTIAELARIAKNNSGWLDTSDSHRKNGKLTIVPMSGWTRDMLWPQTGLKWVATSPYIQNLGAVLGYSMTGLGAQEGGFSHGIGTAYPFRFLRFTGKTAEEVKAALQSRNIPGLSYRVAKTKTKRGAEIEGVYLTVTNWQSFRPTEISFHMMQLAAEWSQGNPFTNIKNSNLFNKHVGSTAWWNEISTAGANARVNHFVRNWTEQAKRFQESTKPYWLYE